MLQSTATDVAKGLRTLSGIKQKRSVLWKASLLWSTESSAGKEYLHRKLAVDEQHQMGLFLSIPTLVRELTLELTKPDQSTSKSIR